MSRILGRVQRRPTILKNFRLVILTLPFALGELGGCAYVIVPEDAGDSVGGASSTSGGTVSDSGGAQGSPDGGSAGPATGGSAAGTGGRFGAGMGGRFGAGMGGRVGSGAGGVLVDPTCTCERTWVASTNITPALTPGDCIGYMGTLYEYDPEMPNQLQWADPACTPPTSGSPNCMYHARLTSRGPCP